LMRKFSGQKYCVTIRTFMRGLSANVI